MVGSVSGSSSWSAQQASSVSAAQRHKEMFNKLDANSDGKVDESELKAILSADGKGTDARTLIKKIDTDGNGTIDQTENDAFLTKSESTKKPSGPPSGPPSGGRAHAGGGAGKAESTSSSSSSSKVFDVMDTNKDGKVSFMERLMFDLQHPDAVKQKYVQSYNQNGQSAGTDTTGGSLNALV
jgi:Ca2+-binding EF-hand superfamily protein